MDGNDYMVLVALLIGSEPLWEYLWKKWKAKKRK